MDEQTTQAPTETQQEQKLDNSQNGLQSKTDNQFERADKIVQELKAENKKKEELIERQEKLAAQEILSGHSQAGQQRAAPKTADEKWAEDAKQRYAGTGLDPTEDNSPTVYA